jgi:hypothetical protein
MRLDPNSPRQLAMAKGDRFYDPGYPCRQGHHSLRYTSGSVCVECAKAHALKPQSQASRANWLRQHPDYHQAYRARLKEQKNGA